MKSLLFFTIAVIFLASCAGPRYTYKFDRYDYNSGRKTSASSLLSLNTSQLTVDASPVPTVPVPGTEATKSDDVRISVGAKYSEMSKAERKEFRQEIRKEFKAYVKAVKKGEGVQSVNETHAMDNDLKLAIVFGAVGLTLTLFGGINEVFWILGVILVVVGVGFLIKWLIRQ